MNCMLQVRVGNVVAVTAAGRTLGADTCVRQQRRKRPLLSQLETNCRTRFLPMHVLSATSCQDVLEVRGRSCGQGGAS